MQISEPPHVPEDFQSARCPGENRTATFLFDMGIAIKIVPGVRADDISLFAGAIGADLAAN
jgi:hypothetical protein